MITFDIDRIDDEHYSIRFRDNQRFVNDDREVFIYVRKQRPDKTIALETVPGYTKFLPSRTEVKPFTFIIQTTDPLYNRYYLRSTDNIKHLKVKKLIDEYKSKNDAVDPDRTEPVSAFDKQADKEYEERLGVSEEPTQSRFDDILQNARNGSSLGRPRY